MEEDKNLLKALDIVSVLLSNDAITTKENSTLYEEYQNNSRVYDLVRTILGRLNLVLFEYDNGLYVCAKESNRVFGYSNEELRKLLGLRVNKELYLCYFIIYHVMLEFYSDTSSANFVEFTRVEDIIKAVDKSASGILGIESGIISESADNEGFKAIALLWDELDTTKGGEEAIIRSARNSKTGFVKMVFNFLVTQQLFTELEGRYYPNKRFKALIENYYDEYRGRIYEIMSQEGEE